MKKTILLFSTLGIFCLLGIALAQSPQNRDAKNGSLSTTRPANSSPFVSSNFDNTPQSSIQSRQQPREKSFGDWMFRTSDGEIVGANLSESFQIKLKTKFGEISVDSSQIVSLRNILEAQKQATGQSVDQALTNFDEKSVETKVRKVVVATDSGDIISGECELDAIEINLKWGKATINVDSMDFICNKKFGLKTIVNQNGAQGWVLADLQMRSVQSQIVSQVRSLQVTAPGTLSQPVINRPTRNRSRVQQPMQNRSPNGFNTIVDQPSVNRPRSTQPASGFQRPTTNFRDN